MVARVVPAAVALLLLASCGSSQNSGENSKVDAVIRIDAEVASARVLVNDRDLGTVSMLRRGIALSPGTHRLEVRHPDFHTHFELLKLYLRERRVIAVKLAERLP